jgi:hypothetical protein
MGKKRTAYRLLVRKPEGKVSLGRPRRRWVDNIRMDLGKVGWGGTDCIDLDHDRDQWVVFVNTVLNLRLQKISGKFLSGCTTAQLAGPRVMFSYHVTFSAPPPVTSFVNPNSYFGTKELEPALFL